VAKPFDEEKDFAAGEAALPEPLYRSPLKLSFHGGLEQEFQQYFSRQNIRSTRFLFCGGLSFFLLFGILDRMMLDTVHSVWLVRYGIGAPLFFLFAFFSFSVLVLVAQQTLIWTAICCYCLVTMLMSFIVPEQFTQLYFTSYMVSMVAGLTLAGMQFRFAVGACLLFIASYSLGVLWFQVAGAVVIMHFAQLLTSSLVCCFGAYMSERSARNDFIQNRIIQLKQTQLEKVNAELKKLVDVDGLTGVANRRHFDERLEEEWRRARRSHYPVALLMIDIDFFKNYNDRHGHQKGDGCLKAVAAVLRLRAQRPGDLAARYGGEEFALILPHLSLEQACEVGRLFCDDIEHLCIEHGASPISPNVTVSVGAASIVPEANLLARSLIETADQALYRSKGTGRNRCTGAVVSNSLKNSAN